MGQTTYRPSKGTLYSESAGEMWNRHMKVPKIVHDLLILVGNINCTNKMSIFTFFCVKDINVIRLYNGSEN